VPNRHTVHSTATPVEHIRKWIITLGTSNRVELLQPIGQSRTQLMLNSCSNSLFSLRMITSPTISCRPISVEWAESNRLHLYTGRLVETGSDRTREGYKSHQQVVSALETLTVLQSVRLCCIEASCEQEVPQRGFYASHSPSCLSTYRQSFIQSS
jgi:hypothetical protein